MTFKSQEINIPQDEKIHWRMLSSEEMLRLRKCLIELLNLDPSINLPTIMHTLNDVFKSQSTSRN